jgi:hypothetical protein
METRRARVVKIEKEIYITTDEEIKESDWCYDSIYGIAQVTKIGNSGILYFDKESFCLGGKEELSRVRKIISTTDTKLGYGDEFGGWYPLSQPSQAFIEKYCKVGGIDEVLVEYIPYSDSQSFKTILKVNSHNEITIHPIKDSWTREEVIELLKESSMLSFKHGIEVSLRGGVTRGDFTITDWIEQNL